MNIDPDGDFWFIPVLVATAPAWVPWFAATVIVVSSALVLDAVGLNPFTHALSKAKSEPDPYARPNQKRQGRERKEQKRKNPNWEGNPNKRTKPLPKHTPGKAHRKY